MKISKRLIIIALALILLPILSVQAFLPKDDPFVELFNGVVLDKVQGLPYQAAIWVEDLSIESSKFKLEHNADKPLAAASVIKLPIMAVCYLLAKEGRFDLEGWYAMADQDRTSGSGDIKGIKTGTKFRHVRLIELMMTRSDNTATNALIRIIGMDKLNKYFKKLGLKETVLNRYILHESRKEGVENYTSVRDNALLLRQIYDGECVSAEASEAMKKFLLKQKVRNRIPRLLPKAVKVANKTGTLFGSFHDVGIVYGEKGDFIICVLVDGDFKKYTKAKNFISDIARVSYDYYLGYVVKEAKDEQQS